MQEGRKQHLHLHAGGERYFIRREEVHAKSVEVSGQGRIVPMFCMGKRGCGRRERESRARVFRKNIIRREKMN